MIKLVFKNIEKSEMVKESVLEKFQPLVDRFPSVSEHDLIVTLDMENSMIQTGPDLFKVKVHFKSGEFKNITFERKASNLYVALSELVDRLHEVIRKSSLKERKIKREKSRDLKEFLDRAEYAF